MTYHWRKSVQYLLFEVSVWVDLQMRAHEVLARVENIVDARVSCNIGCQSQHGSQTLQWSRRAASLQDPASRRHEHAALAENNQNDKVNQNGRNTYRGYALSARSATWRHTRRIITASYQSLRINDHSTMSRISLMIVWGAIEDDRFGLHHFVEVCQNRIQTSKFRLGPDD